MTDHITLAQLDADGAIQEAAFHGEARAKAGLSGETATFAKVAGAHEAAHVAALKKVLGSRAVAGGFITA